MKFKTIIYLVNIFEFLLSSNFKNAIVILKDEMSPKFQGW